MPYLLPSIVNETEELKSVCVYYPDRPEYKAALLGALGYFAQWSAWERNAEKTARIAAKAWQIAHDETCKNWDNECGTGDEMPCDCDTLRQIISEELEKMTINNNIVLGCGCGCGSSGGSMEGVDTLPPEGTQEPLPVIDEPQVPPPTPDYLSWRCSVAYMLHYEMRSAILGIDDGWKNGQRQLEDVDGVIATTLGKQNPAYALLWESYMALVIALGNALSSTETIDIVREWDRAQPDVVCALYGADGANDQRARFRAVIDALNLPWPSRYYLSLLEQNIDYGLWLYNPNWQTIPIEPTWQNRECDCGVDFTPSIPGAPELPAEYVYMVPATYDVTHAPPSGMTADYDGDILTTTRAGTGQDVLINVNESALATRYGCGEIVGMIAVLVSAPKNGGEMNQNFAGVNFPDHYHDSLGEYDTMLSYSVEEDAASVEFASFVANLVGSKKSFNNPAGLPTCDFEVRHNADGEIQQRVYYIGKLSA